MSETQAAATPQTENTTQNQRGERKERGPRPPRNNENREGGDNNNAERGEGGQGGFRRGGPRRGGPRGDRPPRTRGEGENNAEGGNNEERKEGEGGERRGPRRPRRERKEREEITLETVIPPLPTKDQRLHQPNEQEFQDKIADINRKIEDIYTKQKNYIQQMKESWKENRAKKEDGALKDVLRAKFEDRKKLSAEFKTIRERYNQLKTDLEENYEKSQKYRQKLKNLFKEDEIKAELRRLKDEQTTGNISIPREKEIIKLIAELEKALPYAGPYSALQKQADELKEEKNKVRDQQQKAWDQLQALNKEIDLIEQELEDLRSKDQDTKKEVGPAISSKKEEFQAEIQRLKEKRKETERKYYADWDAYEAQQEEIKRIEWMNRVKQRLVRDAERKRRDEERQKEEEEEQKRIEEEKKGFNPYLEDIELCGNLITYCTALLPKTNTTTESQPAMRTDISGALTTDEWKKEKVVVTKSKKEQDEMFYVAPKKKNQPKEAPKPTGPVVQAINHQLDTIKYFDHLKVPVPLFTNKLEDTIKLLQEKQAYFQNLPIPENATPAEGAKTEETNAASPAKQRNNNNRNIDLTNEEEFPKI